MSEMRGPRGVRHATSDYLRAELSRRIDACRLAWDLLDHELPHPVSAPDDPARDAYFEREPASVDRWPLIAVTSGRRTQRGFDLTDSGDPQVRATYPLRVYSWVRDTGWDRTQDLRDDMATAVQIAVLADLRLGTDWLVVAPSTLVVDFSAVQKVQGDRFVAAAYVGFDVHAAETLTDRLALAGGDVRDTVARVEADGLLDDGSLIPPHPALL